MSAVPVTNEAPPPHPGYYGKVPVKGDFVARYLPRAFVEPWDGWLRAALSCSREQLGEEWLASYLVSPVWRFVLSAGLCGDWAVAGVLMPSVDRVGRYYPLVLAALLEGCANPADLAATAGTWYGRAEALARTSLEGEFDLAAFDQLVAQLGLPAHASTEGTGDFVPDGVADPEGGLRLGLTSGAEPVAAYARIVHRLFLSTFSRYSLWWTAGSERIEPSVLISGGLPRAERFAALIDGQWEKWSWTIGAGINASRPMTQA